MNLDLDSNDTEELRHHIHHLLRDYSRTHYTTNYIDFTENLVFEFIKGLKLVSLTDPYSLVIPPDPYDVFSEMHRLSSLPPYDEIFKPTEARSYLKQIMVSPLGIPKSEGAVWDEDYGGDLASHEPIFVALSRKSRQSTPKLGSKKQSHSPESHCALLKRQKIDPIPVEEIKDLPLPVEKILKLELQMDDEDRLAIKSLLQSTYKMSRHQEGYKNNYLDPPLFPDNSLDDGYKRHENLDFVPIFPRGQKPRSGTTPTTSVSTGLRSHADIPGKILPPVEVGYSDDMPMQNMAVVDGWETIRSSPPSSMTMDDTDDDIDELLLPSTPNTEPARIEELFKAHIEIPQFPRSRKIGGYAGIKPHILGGKTLGTFLQPLLEKTIRTDTRPNKEECLHDVLDVEIENLYKDENLDIIMDEVIDEKQNFMIEVPDLPEPNVYSRKEIIFPTKYSEFFIRPDLSYEGSLPHQFLKKTSRQSLNLALSWVAFTIDKKLPTITEIVDITDLFDESNLRNVSGISMSVPLEADLAKAELMLETADSPPNSAENLRFLLCEESSDYRPPDVDDSFKLLLNRSERRRVARLEGRITDMGDTDEEGGSGMLTCDPSHVLESCELSCEPEITLRHLGINTFALLRAKTLTSRQETQLPMPAATPLPVDQDLKMRENPTDIYDLSTIRLPDCITMPQSIHKYMASVDLIQKQALVRSLKSQECLVDLVERQSLGGVDLILDHRSAIIFLSLFMLSSQCDKYVERVGAESWKFRRILVVFEAYPQSCARKGNNTKDSDLDAYTPPILKAIRKFRRDLNIAAACGTKCQETEVPHAFANSVDEGALFTRLYGDLAERNDETGGAIWGDRGWLDVDFLEDEEANLASVNGMNRFSASIILCQVSLADLLNIEPEERITRFGVFIGADTVEKFNIDLERRMQIYASE